MYVAERFTGIWQHYADFMLRHDQEDLHKLRVEIKKTRAIVKLISYASEDRQAITELIPLRHVFKKAGEIRNIHIQIGMLKKYGISNTSIQGKENELKSGITAFISKEEAYRKSIRAAENGILKLIDDIEDDVVLGYMEKLIEKTGKKLDQPEKKENIHKARTLMKLILYTNELVGKRIRDMLPFEIEYIDKLQDLVGNWHDADTTFDALQFYPGIDKKILQSIQDKTDRLGTQIAMIILNFQEQVYSEA